VSDRTDLDRDIAEEDELRRLLTHGDRDLVAPSFATIASASQRPGLAPAFAAGIAAVVIVVTVAGVAALRTPSPAATPLPSAAPTASPEIAVPQVSPIEGPQTSICPSPPRPGHLPWESSETETLSQTARTQSRFFGPGDGITRPEVRVALQAYADDLPAFAPRAIGDRQVTVYSTPSFSSGTAPVVPGQPAPSPSVTLQRPAEARAWWREPSGDCPIVTVALVWPEKSASEQDGTLLRVIASIPAITVPPATTAAPAEHYGLVGRRCCGAIDVLRESNAENLGGIYTIIGFFAISPDGREIAFWDGRELWIAPASAPRSAIRVLSLESEGASGVVWSTDGKELLLAVESSRYTPGPGPQPIYTALRIVGRDGSGLRELARIETGQRVRPLAWDPSRGLGAAVETFGEKGPGRYILVADHPVVISGSTTSNVRFMDLPDAREAQVTIGELRVSIDARFVMATWSYGGRDMIRIWPLEGLDFGRTRELTPSTPGETIRGALWRPRSFEIGVNVSGNFELWTLDGQIRRLRSFDASAVAFMFRYDGTALYSAAMSSGRLELTDLTSGDVSELPSNLGDGSASVRLGP
jgi:hypothetical protein